MTGFYLALLLNISVSLDIPFHYHLSHYYNSDYWVKIYIFFSSQKVAIYMCLINDYLRSVDIDVLLLIDL